MKNRQSGQQIITAAICIALNVGLGKVANMLGLPVTMDTVGTILAASLLPWPIVLGVGLFSSLIASIIINPAYIFYVGTQLVIAIVAIILFRRGLFKKVWTAIVGGLTIGIVSAIASAPVTAIVFGGVSVPNLTALNALFMASGESLWASVVKGSLIVESLDKIAAAVIVWILLRRIASSKDLTSST